MNAHQASLRAKSDILTVTAFVDALADVAAEKRAALNAALEELGPLRARVERLTRMRVELGDSLSPAERDDADAAIDMASDRLDDARIEVCRRMKACRQAASYAERCARFAGRAVTGNVEKETLATAAAAIATACGLARAEAA